MTLTRIGCPCISILFTMETDSVICSLLAMVFCTGRQHLARPGFWSMHGMIFNVVFLRWSAYGIVTVYGNGPTWGYFYSLVFHPRPSPSLQTKASLIHCPHMVELLLFGFTSLVLVIWNFIYKFMYDKYILWLNFIVEFCIGRISFS